MRDGIAVAYPYPDREDAPTEQCAGIRELAFFGRLERRKGLDIFLDALDVLDRLPVLFMGKDTLVDGRPASEIIAERLGDRPHRIETELNRDQAIAELQRGDRLAVIASKSETFGFTVAECVANRIPFVAADSGGIPEAVPHPEAHSRWLFEPTTDGLVAAIEGRLAGDGAAEIAVREEVGTACDTERWNDGVEATYRELLDRPPLPVPTPSREPATVAVAVAHYNHAEFLPAALESLAAQTRPADEVFVMDDGSTDPDAIRVFGELEAQYPEWTFLRQENSGPGAARNACLERSTSTYFAPFDSDNIATPEHLETFLHVIERDEILAAVTCHNLAFVEDEDIAAERFAFRFSPTGGPRIYGLLENVYGDTAAMFRADVLRAAGGFENERWNPHEDWETMVKLALAGEQIQVVPRALFFYRTDRGGRLQALSADGRISARHRKYLAERFYADAELTRDERVELLECLAGFDHAMFRGLQAAIAWHRSELEKAVAWHAELNATIGRAELELAQHRAAGPNRRSWPERASVHAGSRPGVLRRAGRWSRWSLVRMGRAVRDRLSLPES